MSRISITFPANLFSKLQENAALKQISIGQYARDLVALGLRVEEVADQKEAFNGHHSENDHLNDTLKKLWGNNLSWLLESLYLIRYLIRHLSYDESLSAEDNKIYTDELINTAKSKAQSSANELLQS